MVVSYHPRHISKLFTLWDIALHWQTATTEEREDLRQQILLKFPFIDFSCDIYVQMPYPGEWECLEPPMIYINVYTDGEHLIILFPTGEMILNDDFIEF